MPFRHEVDPARDRIARSAAPGAPTRTPRRDTASAVTDRSGPMVRMAGLGRRFGDRWAVRDLTLDVEAGEVLGLLGPNGAGKTTTVRLLTALMAPSEGEASIDGHDVVTDSEAVRERVGILTETPGLYEKLSAEANLDFFGQLYGLDETTRRERSQRLLRVFGLWERRDEAAATFSKGMKQKLAIARALLPEPKVLFLDEPTAALDPEAAFVVREAIASLRSAGRTIVLATHNLDEAQRLCDRIAFVRGGFLRVDTPARLRGAASGPAVDIVLDGDGSALVAAARAVPGVTTADARDGELRVGLADPARVTPELVRSLVAAGAGILEVRPRTASLEDVYFEVMGVHPGSDGALS